MKINNIINTNQYKYVKTEDRHNKAGKAIKETPSSVQSSDGDTLDIRGDYDLEKIELERRRLLDKISPMRP